MRYSIEPRERRYVKEYGILSFAGNLGTHAIKVAKNLNNKYSQKIAGKGTIQKTAEATGDLVGNTIANKITKFQKNQRVNHTQMWLANKYQKKDIYLHKKDKKLLMN